MAVIRELITKWSLDADARKVINFRRSVADLKKTTIKVGVAVGAASAAVGVFLREAGRFEQSEIAFTTLLGNAEKAKSFLNDLAQFAARTPFTLPGVEQNAKQLLAVGIETEKVVPTLKALGDVASGLSVPLERLILNFGQVKTQGKLTGRELRDFAIAGVPLLEILANQMGKTKEEITEMVSKGKVGFEDVEKAFISLTSEGGRFSNLMDKQSRSLFGLLSNLKDQLILIARELGGPILEDAKGLVKVIQLWIRENKELVKTNVNKVLKVSIGFIKDIFVIGSKTVKVMTKLTKAFGGWATVLKAAAIAAAGFVSLQLLATFGSLAGSVFMVTKGLGALALGYKSAAGAAALLNLKMLLIPAAIGATVIGLGLLIDDIKGFAEGKKSAFGQFVDALRKFEKSGSFFGEVMKFFNDYLNPVTAILRVFEGIHQLMTAIEVSARTGILRDVFKFFGLTPSLGNDEGNKDKFERIGNEATVLAPELFPQLKGADSGKKITQNNEINFNGRQDTSDESRAKIKSDLDEVFRKTLRDLKPALSE